MEVNCQIRTCPRAAGIRQIAAVQIQQYGFAAVDLTGARFQHATVASRNSSTKCVDPNKFLWYH